jgi:hypothetical protein
MEEMREDGRKEREFFLCGWNYILTLSFSSVSVKLNVIFLRKKGGVYGKGNKEVKFPSLL